MTAKAYKIIFGLLSFCVLSILILQGFWIRNFYVQKMDEFNKTVYSALEQVTAKLQERDNVRMFEETMIVLNGDTVVRPENNKHPRYVSVYGKSPMKKSYTLTQKNKKGKTNVLLTDSVFVDSTPGKFYKKSIVTVYNDNSSGSKKTISKVENKTLDRNLQTLNTSLKDVEKTLQKSTVVLKSTEKTITQLSEGAEDMAKLVNKMMSEIKYLHREEKNQDTIKTIIKKALESKGVFIPFEFSLRKILKNKMDTVAQSPGFNELKKYYPADLSVNKVFDTHSYLWLQFSGSNNLVMAGIKGSIILSLVFSLVIISAFYYTILLILRQKKLSEIKNDFVNNMTHELKTPIATISLALDAINNPQVKNNEARFNDYTRILKEENKKLNNHVERVLQMALLEKGELQLNEKQVDVVAIIESTIDTYKLQISEQKAKVYFVPPVEKIIIYADELHLQTVFNNLLDNALKYSKENCVITINSTKNANEITVSFKDNGIGINNDQKEKIFDKFYRAQGGNLHDVKGFGLGLSYVRSIVEAHNGSIELCSEKGKGSEFILRFKIIER